jgi:hypothetical protein
MKLKNIKSIVENVFNIENISRKTRKRNYVYARYVYMYLAREKTRYSLVYIGNYIKLDHATVLHGIKTIQNIFSLHQDDRLQIAFNECLMLVEKELDLDFEPTTETTIDQVTKFYYLKYLKIQEKYRNYISKLENKTKNYTSSLILKEALELSPEDFKIFEKRAQATINSLKSIKTYENTPKSSFNVKTSREMIDI